VAALEINIEDSTPHKVVKISTYFCPRGRIFFAPLGGSEGVMPNRAKSFASALFGGVLAGGVLAAALPFSLSVTASAAGECLESPNERTAQSGHWYYHFDRSLGRRCWFFQPSDARSSDSKPSESASPQTAAAPPATNQDAQQSLLSRITSGFSQGFSPPPPQQNLPQQATVPDDQGDPAKTSQRTPRVTKVSRREKEKDRPQAAPAPATSGVAVDDRQPDSSQQHASIAEKDEKPAAPANVAEREALFQDFMKWQRDRTMYGFGGRW
jgi:hypothetical protein